jgi:DNA-binding response OmpR family regulator
MRKFKILLAEDEPFLGKIILESLESRGFAVSWAQDGLKAYSIFRSLTPDLCVLDVMMPQKDGFSLAMDIRNIDIQVPIIFLTAKSHTEDVLKGFGLGGNDYIKKPFSMEELIVRINALLIRYNHNKSEIPRLIFEVGRYVFDTTAQDLTLGSHCVKLSHRESMLLKLLIEHKNEVLDRRIALDHLWGEVNQFTARSMDVFITKLRKHLREDPKIQIINIRGVGYKLITEMGIDSPHFR